MVCAGIHVMPSWHSRTGRSRTLAGLAAGPAFGDGPAMLRAVFALVVVVLLSPLANAQPSEIPDEQLYRCKNTQGDVAVTFKPEIEVRELVSWAVGFTCKEFI